MNGYCLSMNLKVKKTDILLTVVLICVGVVLRLLVADYPNISPVAALALLAGYVLVHRGLAVAVPLGILLVSDLQFGASNPIVMISVYSLLALPVLAGKPLRNLHRSGKSPTLNFASVGVSGVVFSILFYVGTNFAFWVSSSFYTKDMAGLLECYAAALPFFRQTLLGDMIFVSLFFCGYAICKLWLFQKQTSLSRN